MHDFLEFQVICFRWLFCNGAQGYRQYPTYDGTGEGIDCDKHSKGATLVKIKPGYPREGQDDGHPKKR
jgi:hypothetical protein